MKNSIVEKTYRYFKEKRQTIAKKDIELYLKCQNKADYSEMHKTDLYINKGVLYCRMLEVLNLFEQGKENFNI